MVRVSNGNWESLPGYEGLIAVGAEVVHGTGDVGLRLEAEPVAGIEPVIICYELTPGAALSLAALLTRQAQEAIRAQQRARSERIQLEQKRAAAVPWNRRRDGGNAGCLLRHREVL
jgi:hypothetical protein